MRKIVITITLHENKSVSVTAPLHDKPLCIDLLEVAKEIVKNHKPGLIVQAEQPDIVKPTFKLIQKNGS